MQNEKTPKVGQHFISKYNNEREVKVIEVKEYPRKNMIYYRLHNKPKGILFFMSQTTFLRCYQEI